MSAFGTALTIFLAFTLGVWWWRGRVGGSHPFWLLAAARPDQAYDWFVAESAWVLKDSLGEAETPNRRLSGPFRLTVPKLGQKTALIFGDEAMMEESQARFLAKFGENWRAPRPKFALLILLWPITNMWYLHSASDKAETISSLLGFGLSHLGYLILAAGILLGRFGIFGLRSRGSTILAALAALAIGFVLVNA